ncbi:hypothetical protein [Clostridium uliginosum]|uniref:Uncharacterized protein n=1 Tax=Clostridium uliginosum TaxID=119641 RepID=A0A1I1IZK8_9CLOT|nr:hypothetical protein [Clostridium uliginosum]SFC39818.1 hypothetical protein SAMN05421842_10379 [Clostridium uliginosum]
MGLITDDQLVFKSFSIADLDEMIAENHHNESIASGDISSSMAFNCFCGGIASALVDAATTVLAGATAGTVSGIITIPAMLALLEAERANIQNLVGRLENGGHHGISTTTYLRFDGWGTGGPSSGYPTYKAYKVRCSIY